MGKEGKRNAKMGRDAEKGREQDRTRKGRNSCARKEKVEKGR